MFFLFFLLGWVVPSWGETLSESTAWHNLLHYQKHLTGLKSEADGAGFFLSKNGKRNPEEELKATITALQETNKTYGKIKAPAACVFPARKKFLENHGYVFPEVVCTDYANWRKGLPVTSVSLVFATAYPNNPASMFGHTFLRLNGPGEGNNLLDYVVNFAATTGEAGGIEFALLGVFGGYEGHYSLAPYFIKVNEYNHGEARDLWEYPLDLSPAAIDMLLAHLWEMEASSYFDYYFFDENCSWQILRLLEAADPKLKLTTNTPFYIIPAETVKILKEKDLLNEPKFRPSLRRQYIGMEDSLDKILLKFRILDRRGKLSSSEKEKYHEALLVRSKKTKSLDLKDTPTAENRPDLGHGLSRVGLTQGDSYRRFELKVTQHDLLDSDIGHEPWSALDVVRVTAEEREGEILLRDFSLVDVTSLHAWDNLGYEPSWFLNLGLSSPREFSCRKCTTGFFRGGLGQTLKTQNEKLFGSIFLSTRAYGLRRHGSGEFFGVGPRILVGIKEKRFKTLFEIEKLWTNDDDYHLFSDISFSYEVSKEFSMRAGIRNFNSKLLSESELTLLYYF